MPRKTTKGTGYTASETALWRATTPQQKAYWSDIVQKERAQTGQGIHFFEEHPVGKLIGPALQGLVHYSQYLPQVAHFAGRVVSRVAKKVVTGRGPAKPKPKPRTRKPKQQRGGSFAGDLIQGAKMIKANPALYTQLGDMLDKIPATGSGIKRKRKNNRK